MGQWIFQPSMVLVDLFQTKSIIFWTRVFTVFDRVGIWFPQRLFNRSIKLHAISQLLSICLWFWHLFQSFSMGPGGERISWEYLKNITFLVETIAFWLLLRSKITEIDFDNENKNLQRAKLVMCIRWNICIDPMLTIKKHIVRKVFRRGWICRTWLLSKVLWR